MAASPQVEECGPAAAPRNCAAESRITPKTRGKGTVQPRRSLVRPPDAVAVDSWLRERQENPRTAARPALVRAAQAVPRARAMVPRGSPTTDPPAPPPYVSHSSTVRHNAHRARTRPRTGILIR
ncbi:hypothetical protein GCM10027073_03680 [Streptomyces chlorus]